MTRHRPRPRLEVVRRLAPPTRKRREVAAGAERLVDALRESRVRRKGVVRRWRQLDHGSTQLQRNMQSRERELQGVDVALRRAKLDYLATAKGADAHPALWSSFIHMGSTKPVPLQTKGWGLLPWGLGAALLVLLGGLWWMRSSRHWEVAQAY